MTVVMRERLPSVIFEGLSRDQTERLTLDREVAETYGFKTEVQPVSANALLWVIGRCLSTGADWAKTSVAQKNYGLATIISSTRPSFFVWEGLRETVVNFCGPCNLHCKE